MKLLALQVLAFLVAVVGIDRFLAYYVPRHSISLRRMGDAVSTAEPGAVVFSGDSRMVAAIDHEALRSGGLKGPIVDLSLQSTHITWQALALRQYLRHAPAPRLVVLGYCGDDLLVNDDIDPDGWTGLSLSNYHWSDWRDAARLWPERSVADLDRRLRFFLNKSNHIGSSKSLLWQKWQDASSRFLLRERERDQPRNAFGRLADMAAMNAAYRERWAGRPKAGEAWNPLFEGLCRELRDRGITLVLVELPMPTNYRAEVTRTPEMAKLRDRLRREVEARGGLLIDLGDPPWIADADFLDGTHLGPTGARKVSAELAVRLRAILAEGHR